MRNRNQKRKLIGQMKQSQQLQIYSIEWTAQHAKRALDHLASLIRAEHIPPVQALILAAVTMDHNITGKQRWMSEQEIQKICFIIISAWGMKLFSPSSNYPYTYTQTLAAWKKLPLVESGAE